MAGVSEMPYRRIARALGASAAPTELVSAKGLIYGQSRTQRYLRHHPSEQPFWVQIFGGEPETMALAAERAVQLGAKILDVNMGCPVKKVTRQGSGSALLKDPRRAGAIVEAMVRRTGVPVTVKIRSGWDEDSIIALELGKVAADSGASAIALHARTRRQGYSGKADWSLLRRLVRASSIPVIGNGDAFTAERARAMLEQTGCAAVMIGRGALGNPWIFSELNQGGAPPSAADRWQTIRQHWNEHLEFVGDILSAIRRFRQQLCWYSHGLGGAAAFRREIMGIESPSELLERCEAFFSGAIDADCKTGAEVNTAKALG